MFFTEPELLRFQNLFGKPITDNLYNLLTDSTAHLEKSRRILLGTTSRDIRTPKDPGFSKSHCVPISTSTTPSIYSSSRLTSNRYFMSWMIRLGINLQDGFQMRRPRLFGEPCGFIGCTSIWDLPASSHMMHLSSSSIASSRLTQSCCTIRADQFVQFYVILRTI